MTRVVSRRIQLQGNFTRETKFTRVIHLPHAGRRGERRRPRTRPFSRHMSLEHRVGPSLVMSRYFSEGVSREFQFKNARRSATRLQSVSLPNKQREFARKSAIEQGEKNFPVLLKAQKG